jgi:adenylate kinase
MVNNKHLIISGIQGSGKGTQAELLQENQGYVHISTGNLCRWHLANKTTFGKELALINEGKLVSDDFMVQLLERRLHIHDFQYSFLLDGFPRSMAQVEHVFAKYEIAGVVHLELSQEIAMQRAQARMDGKQVRADDNEKTLVKRFELFHKHTEPLLEFYEKKGILHRVAADSPIETVHQGIVSSLEAKGIL